MALRKVKLTFPQELIKEPVIGRVSKRFDLMPNIRRANVTESVGEMWLEFEGTEENLDQGIRYMTDLGVLVEPIEGDILQ